MGGNAFKVEGFKVPRIPTDLYRRLVTQYAKRLTKLYVNVTSAEAPMWKVDHGDVDMLVEGPRRDITNSDISEALGAKVYKGQWPTLNFAMPHPEIPDSIVQLDVQLCPRGYFQWQVFQASYSDLAQIIGVIIRGLGLTANDKGLHVRIAEIESINKKESMIHLTHDPETHMDFLGLDRQKFREGLNSEEDLFHWIAGCRFLNRQNIVPNQHGPMESENHNDRARRQKRTMFCAFTEDFMVSNPDLGNNCQWDRAKVLHEALEVFDRHQEYSSKLAAHTEQEREKALWTAIRNVIPRTGPSLKTTTRGLLRFVSVLNGEVKFNKHPVPDEERTPWVRGLDVAGENALLQWVQDNWDAVRVREKAHENATKTTAKISNAKGSVTEHKAKKMKLNCGNEAALVPRPFADGNS